MIMLTYRKVTAKDFELAALPHLNNIFHTAVRLTSNRTEAEDLVQEVYLQAWKSFHSFEPGTNCRAWLFKILSHKVKHYYRTKLKFKFVDESEKLLDVMVYTPPVPEHLSDEEVLASLEKIPLCYRQAVLLADVEEFSYKEMADILNVPVGTIMSRLSRGRKLLRIGLTGGVCRANDKAQRMTSAA